MSTENRIHIFTSTLQKLRAKLEAGDEVVISFVYDYERF